MSIYLGDKKLAGSVKLYPTIGQNTDGAMTQKAATDSFLNTNQITNCITYIPQDIKLELNNGVLTLKAGSKVYVPNGAGVFDEITIASDLTNVSTGSASNTQVLIYNGSGIFPYLSTAAYSGATQPTPGTQYAVWYDTTNNKIKTTADTGSTWQETGSSLPVAIISKTNGIWTSIDQVFNGFGYIGSTVFVLPGVKGLIPNGFNDDGSLKNTAFEVSSVISETDSSNFTDHIFVVTDGSTVSRFSYISFNYNKYTNKNESNSGSVVNKCIFARVYRISGKVETLDSATVFHALDYNDTEYIAHNAMPSDRFDNLTLGASGSTYTAPADGYFVICLRSTGSAYVSLRPSGIIFTQINADSGKDLACYVPVREGQTVQAYYANASISQNWNYFRFYYANGAQ